MKFVILFQYFSEVFYRNYTSNNTFILSSYMQQSVFAKEDFDTLLNHCK